MKQIAIVGLGQIGGSIVLSLRKQNRAYSITGMDRSRKRIRLLGSRLDRSCTKWSDISNVDLVINCLHFEDAMDFLRQSNPEQLQMDVCSGKSQILQLANRRKLRFIGGHPMAGNEFALEKGWRDDLFDGAPFFLCRSRNASKRDLRFVQSFVRHLGGIPLHVDAKLHDRFVSVTSHFPAILAGMLADMGKNIPPAFKGPGFQSMTRLAKTSPELLKTFLDSNGANIQKSTKQLQKRLKHWIEGS